MTDPMLAPWPGPHGGLPPLDAIAPDRFVAAAEVAIAEARREIEAVAADSARPDYANSVSALGDCGRALGRLREVIELARDTLGTPEIMAAASTVMPRLAVHDAWLWQQAGLLARLRAVRVAEPALAPTRRRLLDRLIARFERGGADLSSDDRVRLAAIDERMAGLHAGFRTMVTEDEADLLLLSAADLDSLPDDMAANARATAKARDIDAPGALPSSLSTIPSLLTKAADRELRERGWRLFAGRGRRSETRSTLPLIREILALRSERAALLGFASHAAFVTSDRMAGSPERAMALLDRLWPDALHKAQREIEMLVALAAEDGIDVLEPWDVSYYRERLRRRDLGADEASFGRYLTLDGMRDAVFWMAGQLYGLSFAALPEAPVHHPSVQAYTVERDGQVIGLLYLDLFARPGKAGGAWVKPLRDAERGRTLPLITLVHNVAPPPGTVAHLRLWDAVTMFHEFGHALHGLLGAVEDHRQGLYGTVWDFVEAPSTLAEHWLLAPEILERFAIEPESGEPMPAELRVALGRALAKSGIETVGYLAQAIVDLRLHMAAEPITDPQAAEAATLAAIGMPHALTPIHPLTAFRHIFAGSEPTYSAGYYVYIWAELMSADIAESFRAAPGGLFDKPTAERLERTLLSVGDAVAPADAVRAFLGRDAEPEALMRARGLLPV